MTDLLRNTVNGFWLASGGALRFGRIPESRGSCGAWCSSCDQLNVNEDLIGRFYYPYGDYHSLPTRSGIGFCLMQRGRISFS